MLQKYIHISLYAPSVFLNHKTDFDTSVNSFMFYINSNYFCFFNEMSRLCNCGEYIVFPLKKQLQFSQQQNLFLKQIK